MHLDIKRAFQNGKLYDIVCVVQRGELGDNSGRVCKLNWALYGLKQEACEWHKVLVSLWHDLDFVHSHSDPDLFIRILLRFKGRSQAEIGHGLGMGILRERKARTMSITHRKKISDLLSANSMQECRTSPTPLVPKEKLNSMKKDPSQELDEITVDWIGAKFMVADGLTKVLPGPALSNMSDKLHLVDVEPTPRDACGGVLHGKSNIATCLWGSIITKFQDTHA